MWETLLVLCELDLKRYSGGLSDIEVLERTKSEAPSYMNVGPPVTCRCFQQSCKILGR